MSVITQKYDIDLKATGEYPVVKMSQFDTGSRTIVFTVYHGRDLAQIDGMVARVDGTRTDGVEFSVACTVGTGSKVSFTISQEMTKIAGKHTAELVILDEDGNPIGTQNFIVEVEPASMSRDSAASADDRTLYDQYTDSVEHKFSKLSASLTAKADAIDKTAKDISSLVGASNNPTTIYSEDVQFNGSDTIHVRLTYDPVAALVHARAYGSLEIGPDSSAGYDLCRVDSKYCPDEKFFDYAFGGDRVYLISKDSLEGVISGDSPKQPKNQLFYLREDSGAYTLRYALDGSVAPDHAVSCELSLDAVWYARGGKYIGATPISIGSNTLKIGTVTTGDPGTQASAVNAGTAKDVVIDFTIPRGAIGEEGPKGDKGDIGLPALVMKRAFVNEYQVGATFTGKVSDCLNRTPLIGEYSFALTGSGKNIIVWQCTTQSGDTFSGKVISCQSLLGAKGATTDTYVVGSGLTSGTWYGDYTWKYCRLRVVGGICTLSFHAVRNRDPWVAEAWNQAHVLTLPDGLGILGELNIPIVTNANSEPNNNTVVHIDGTTVSFRSTVNVTYGTGTWFQGSVSWVAAGTESDDVSSEPDDSTVTGEGTDMVVHDPS